MYLIVEATAVSPEGRISPCRENKTQLRRKVLDEIGQGGVHLLLSDHLIVIQDQHKVMACLQQQVDQCF